MSLSRTNVSFIVDNVRNWRIFDIFNQPWYLFRGAGDLFFLLYILKLYITMINQAKFEWKSIVSSISMELQNLRVANSKIFFLTAVNMTICIFNWLVDSYSESGVQFTGSKFRYKVQEKYWKHSNMPELDSLLKICCENIGYNTTSMSDYQSISSRSRELTVWSTWLYILKSFIMWEAESGQITTFLYKFAHCKNTKMLFYFSVNCTK